MRLLDNADSPAGWGEIKTVDPVAPATPTAIAATQEAQSTSSSAQTIQVAQTLAPPPLIAPIVGNYQVTPEWARWFTKIRTTGSATSDDAAIMQGFDSIGGAPRQDQDCCAYSDNSEILGQIAALRSQLDQIQLDILSQPVKAADSALLAGKPPSYYAGGADTYSTTETATNKVWTNGKTIYRKVFTYNWTSNTSWTLSHGITGLTEVVNLSGTFFRTSQSRWLSMPTAAGGNSFTIQADSTDIYFYSDTGGYIPGLVTIILEYTK